MTTPIQTPEEFKNEMLQIEKELAVYSTFKYGESNEVIVQLKDRRKVVVKKEYII